MKPVLYSKDGNNVIGTLEETVSGNVIEQLNRTYTANFTYPHTGDFFSQIDYDSIVLLKANQKSALQKFRISSIGKPINGIASYGLEHISYELNRNPILIVNYSGNPCTAFQILNNILVSTAVHAPYYGKSDITGVKKCELDFMSARDAILKVQQYFGGELEWDNHDIILHSKRGVDSGAVISYGNNLLDYNYKIDVSNVYTAIVPYMQLNDNSGKKHTYSLPEKIIKYGNSDNYAYVRAKTVDLTSEFTEKDLENCDYDNLDASTEYFEGLLRLKAYNYLAKHFDVAETNIAQNVTLSYVDLRKAKEFATIDTMNDLGLGDFVTLKDERTGINYKAKVTSTKFNFINEMYDSIEIGNPTQQLLDELASIINFDDDSETTGEKIEEIEKNLDEYFSEIKVADNSITFKSGNVKSREGAYNTYKYKLERDTDIQEEGKKGKIISFTDPQNRKTKIVRE